MNGTHVGKPLRVLVVDDNTVIRAGLRALMGTDPRLTVVGEADNGRSAVEAARRQRPDVVLLDIRMPHDNGLSVLPALASVSRVLMLTYTQDLAAIAYAIRLGASGYLVHGDFTPDELLRAVLRASPQSAHLSPIAAALMMRQVRGEGGGARRTRTGRAAELLSRRESEIMDLIACGLTNSIIAKQLFLSEKTVKNHINHIFGKLDVRNRAEAIARWLGTSQTDSPGRVGPDQSRHVAARLLGDPTKWAHE